MIRFTQVSSPFSRGLRGLLLGGALVSIPALGLAGASALAEEETEEPAEPEDEEGEESEASSVDSETQSEPSAEGKDEEKPEGEGIDLGPNFGKLPPNANEDDAHPARLNGDIPGMVESQTPLGNFMDTRLSFSLSDDNWLQGPGETTPSSPFVDFSPRTNNQLFFDNLNRRDTGYETLSHMVLHRRQAGFIPGLETEAAIVARFIFFSDDATGKTGSTFRDDGSYLRVRYFFNQSLDDPKAANIDVVAFPFNTNRFRLGYLWDISWAGQTVFPGRGNATPGAKMQLNVLDGYAFVGAKTARLLDESIREIQSYWGGLTGAGYDFADMFQIDVGAGIFQKGTNPRPGVEGEPVLAGGFSGRMAFHYGTSVPGSVDFRLYRQDPALTDLFRVSNRAKDGLSLLLALEYTHLEQVLQDPAQANSTKLEGWDEGTLLGGANAAALSAKLGWNNFYVGADAIYRDLSFILWDRPGFVPFQDFPALSQQTPEFLFAFSTSYFIEWLHLTPGFVIGVQQPATFTGLLPNDLVSELLQGQQDIAQSDQDLTGARSVVVRNISSQDILPCAEYNDADARNRICTSPQSAELIYAARFALKWDLSDMFAIVAETTFFIDNNQTDIVDSATGITTRERISNFSFAIPGDEPISLLPGTTAPHNLRLAGGLFAQARF